MPTARCYSCSWLRPAGYVLFATLGIVGLCWLTVGDNSDSRFLLPAVVMSLSLLPLSFGASPRLNGMVHGLYIAGIIWVLVGAPTTITVPFLPPFMGD